MSYLHAPLIPDSRADEVKMKHLKHLFENNRAWVEATLAADPRFFEDLSDQQTPKYLWIGCSDSRVPANQIVGLPPGELFVHRNIANLVVEDDINCLSVLQYAVDVLKVKHIIVCGHYGCGGVQAALHGDALGLIDRWLQHLANLKERHAVLLDSKSDFEARSDLLCEINVLEQVQSACQTSVVLDAWKRGHDLTVHGWIYNIGDGLIRDLGCTVTAENEIRSATEGAFNLIR